MTTNCETLTNTNFKNRNDMSKKTTGAAKIQ